MCAAILLALALPAHAQTGRTLKLTSLEWPPYSGQNLPHQGLSSAVVSAALGSMGERVAISFYPWNRATALVRTESNFIGYFPEYMSKELEATCHLSDPIGSGPLGFAERSDAPVRWERLEDLARVKVGLVTGYVNSDRFDDRVRQGLQPVDYAGSDKQNLLKLAARRVPLALIDRRVFEYLVRHDSQVAAIAPELHFNVRLLEMKNLYVCFRRNAEGDHVRKLFNEGLRKIDTPAVIETPVALP
jgi:polar amino acid transport system substrate-binding protein